MTDRLYYADASLLAFDASVVESRDNGLRVVLDRSAFYPSSGGQPNDLGTLNGVAVLDVIDEDDSVVHILGAPLPPGPVHGIVDAARRFDHMQQHTGQHLLSAVFEESFGAKTVSFHLGTDVSTIDIDTPDLTPAQLEAAELQANRRIAENLPVTVAFEDAATAQGLRKATDRTGPLRIVSIGALDRSACGGTHVASTGEIGCLFLRRTEKMRGNLRVEFICGLRAVRRVRQEYDALARIGRLFSAGPEETPALVANAMEQARESDKQRRKLAVALAERMGRELYAATEPGPGGIRRREETIARGPIPEETRTLALSFTAQEHALFIAVASDPPSLLLAVSPDSGLNAGQLLKEFLQAAGGRGGGNAVTAQGSLPSPEALQQVLEKVRSL